jgi:hypothetical protein
LNKDEVHLVLQTLFGMFWEHQFRAFTVTKGAFSLTKSAFSLTNFKHETMLMPGVTLPNEDL